jgi:MFS family permease
MATALRPLRLRAFPQLALASLVNTMGNWLGEIALAVIVFDRTGSALATAGLFLGTQFVPALLAPPIVARLEFLGARRSLPLLYLSEAAAFGLLALGADELALAAILLLASIDGALASGARALTRAAAGAVLTPAGMLREGNAILNLGFTAGAAAGPALGGLVVAGAGPKTALAVDAASFLAVALVLATASGLKPADPETVGVIERLRRAVGYVRSRLLLRRLLAAQAAAFTFFAVVIPIEVVFAKQTLDAGDAGYGALLASWGAGMVAGSLLFAAVRRADLRLLLVLSTLAIGVAYLVTGLAPTLLVACVASVLGGLGNGIQWVALVTAVQELTGTAYQARVIAMLESIASAMPGLGFVIGGAVAAALDPRASYIVAGSGVILVLGIGILALRGADWSAAHTAAGPDSADAEQQTPLADPRRPADAAADAN